MMVQFVYGDRTTWIGEDQIGEEHIAKEIHVPIDICH